MIEARILESPQMDFDIIVSGKEERYENREKNYSGCGIFKHYRH
jgi:hypothetical protein